MSESLAPRAIPKPAGGIRLQANDFELFGLKPAMTLDRATLDARWKALQAGTHPDRFATADPVAQRQAMQGSVRINEAYQRLKDPLRRAAYLCELHGVAVDAERNTAMPSDFLVQQMQWREALEDARDAGELQSLADEVQAARRERLDLMHKLADERGDHHSLASHVRALMFIERFARDVEDRLEQLGQ